MKTIDKLTYQQAESLLYATQYVATEKVDGTFLEVGIGDYGSLRARTQRSAWVGPDEDFPTYAEWFSNVHSAEVTPLVRSISYSVEAVLSSKQLAQQVHRLAITSRDGKRTFPFEMLSLYMAESVSGDRYELVGYKFVRTTYLDPSMQTVTLAPHNPSTCGLQEFEEGGIRLFFPTQRLVEIRSASAAIMLLRAQQEVRHAEGTAAYRAAVNSFRNTQLSEYLWDCVSRAPTAIRSCDPEGWVFETTTSAGRIAFKRFASGWKETALNKLMKEEEDGR